MGVNRFYQPSAPRYTSQFVEDRYPEELILQAGAMKYGQQQQFAKDIGEISSLTSLITPGYRTQRMAPVVKQQWSKKINDLTTRFGSSYDTPQAAMELSKLRNDWMGDPNIQLIRMDFAEGNKERDAMLRNTKTYHLDYDPNTDPNTKLVKQFNPGDPYRPYEPLTPFADPVERAMNIFQSVKPDMIPQMGYKKIKDPVTGEDINIPYEGYKEYIDMKKLSPAIKTLVDEVKKGESPEAQWLLTRYKDETGNRRKPTDKELIDYFGTLGQNFLSTRENLNFSFPTQSSGGTGGGGGGFNPEGIASFPIGSIKAADNYMQMNKTMVNQARLLDGMAGMNIPLETNDNFKNSLYKISQNNPGILKASEKEKAKALKEYIRKTGQEQIRLNVDRFTDPAENKAATNFFFGDELVSGKMPKNFTGGMFMESQVYDMESGEKLEESDKKNLLQEDNTAQIVGRISADKSILSPFPVAWEVQIGEKGGTRRLLVPGSSKDIQTQKVRWNFFNFQRHKDTNIGDPFQLDLYSGKGINITDVSDFGRENDPKTLTEAQPLYIVPMQDYTNTDQNGNPSTKIKVYAYNPILEEGTPVEGMELPSVNMGIPGVGEAVAGIGNKFMGNINKPTTLPINKGLLDNTNKLFIKEYDLSQFSNQKDESGKYVDPMTGLIKQLLTDHQELYTRKYEILNSMFPQ